MKIFHTADWHLGKIIHGVYMTEDQAFVLDQFIEAIKTEKPDVVIIAGDIYDRAIPPTEAINLFNHILSKIVLELNTPVIAIGGNHDSPSRLNFGRDFMAEKGFHIISEFSLHEPIILNDAFGAVHFHPIPYFEPATVRNFFQDDSIATHNDAMKVVIKKLTEEHTEKPNLKNRHVAIAHAFIIHSSQSVLTSDSERPLAIGGSEFIEANHFMPFQYTALGHLHQTQIVKDETIQYSGSILKYSLSEANHKKGFLIIDIDENGDVTTEKHFLTPRRDLREVRITMNELLKHPISEDYVFVTLLDETPILQPMEKVRTVYPNAMHVQREIKRNRSSSANLERLKQIEKQDDLALFHAFYESLTDKKADSETIKIIQSALESAKSEDRA